MADTRLLVGLILSLLLSSLLIGLVTGQTNAELGTTALYKPVNINMSNQSSSFDYEVNTLTLGNWEKTDNGLKSVSDTLTNEVYFIKIWPKDGIYDNSYLIYNPNHLKYDILVRETSLFSDSIRVGVNSNYIEVKSKNLFGYTPYKVIISNSVNLSSEYWIKTILNEKERTVTIYINDVIVGQAGNIPADSILSFGQNKYSGISVIGKDLYIKSLTSMGNSMEESSFDIWAFISSMAGVLSWYTESGNPIVDLFVNLIIKIQQFGIVAVIVTIIRGN